MTQFPGYLKAANVLGSFTALPQETSPQASNPLSPVQENAKQACKALS
jgi:hypothetical protein